MIWMLSLGITSVRRDVARELSARGGQLRDVYSRDEVVFIQDKGLSLRLLGRIIHNNFRSSVEGKKKI